MLGPNRHGLEKIKPLAKNQPQKIDLSPIVLIYFNIKRQFFESEKSGRFVQHVTGLFD
jgi:hypothetical protein